MDALVVVGLAVLITLAVLVVGGWRRRRPDARPRHGSGRRRPAVDVWHGDPRRTVVDRPAERTPSLWRPIRASLGAGLR